MDIHQLEIQFQDGQIFGYETAEGFGRPGHRFLGVLMGLIPDHCPNDSDYGNQADGN
jgi:hypothetical protein